MNRFIVGLMGPMAAGKGVVADFLLGHGFAYYSLSDRVKTEAARLHRQRTNRQDLQDLGNSLRRDFGASVLADATAALIDTSPHPKVLIDSIRHPAELQA